MATACGGSASSGTAKAGYNMLITTDLSGPFAGVAGIPMSQAFQAYLAEVNARGGVNGHRLSVTLLDDRSDVATGVANYQRAVSSGDLAVVGITASAIFAALGPRATQDQIVETAFASVEEQVYPWLFKMNAPTSVHASTAINFVVSRASASGRRNARVSAVGYDSPGVRAFFGVVKTDALAAGLRIAEPRFVPVSTGDFSVIGGAVAAEQPDFVITDLLESLLPQFVAALRSRGVGAVLVNSVSAISDLALKRIADPDVYVTRETAAPGDVGNAGVAAMRRQASASHFDQNVDVTSYILGYVHAMVVVQALQICPDPCTRSQLRSALERVLVRTNGLTAGEAGYSPSRHTMLMEAAVEHIDSAKGYAVAVPGFGFGT